jgi:DNA-binding PucR family transcriptional regulator
VNAEAIVEFTETLARIATSGGGAKALAAHLATATGGSVLIEDAHWRHVAAAGNGAVPASARNVVESDAPGMAQRIGTGSHALGWVSLFGVNGAPSAGLLLRLTAAAIGVELARNGAAQRTQSAGFWDSVLAESTADHIALRDDAAARGIALAPHYVAIALEAENDDGVITDLAEVRALALAALRCSDGETGVAQRGSTLFLFVPAARSVDASNAATAATLLPKSAARRVPHLRISGGVGGPVPPNSLHAAARAAEAALGIARKIYGPGRVGVYDELGAYRLIYEGATVDGLRAFASQVLAPLRNYDEQHQTELDRTLRLYFKVGQNVKTAAAELNVHRHTVFYRLRQIGEICARSLETPHDQLTLRLAIVIDELHTTL